MRFNLLLDVLTFTKFEFELLRKALDILKVKLSFKFTQLILNETVLLHTKAK